jgi:polysaccharide biosynthesis transport protein
MTLTQLIAAMRDRWKTIGAITALGVLLAAAVTILMPKRYEATATVVVDAKPVDALGGFSGGSLPTAMATQYDIIQSDIVAKKVLGKTGLLQSPVLRESWQERTGGEGSYVGWAAKFIKQNLIIKPSRDSNVIAIGYEGDDPRFAAAIANAFAAAYIEVALDLRVSPAKQYSRFFDESLADAKKRVDEARSRLSTYLRENDLISSDERLDNELTKLNDLSQQLVMLRSLSADSSNRAAQSNAGRTDRLQDAMNHPNVTSIKSNIVQEETQLKQLAATYGENHPLVVQSNAALGELRRKLAQEIQRMGESVNVTSTVNRAREAEVNQAYEAQRKRVLKLKESRDTAAVLSKDVQSAEQAYDSISARMNQNGLEGQSNMTNVQLLSNADIPSLASTPNITLNMMVGTVLSLVLGFVAAVFVELNQRKIRTEEDVEELFGETPLTVLRSVNQSSVVTPLMRVLGKKGTRQLSLPAPHSN